MTHPDSIELLLLKVRDEYTSRMTAGDDALLQQVDRYLVERNGKMLRPRLTLAAASTLGDAALHSRRTLLMATAVEMVHNTSLLHDDVIDRSDSRRGRPSVNSRWNNATAVLVGDYHLAQIMRLLNEADDREASERVNQTVIAMCEGELLQQQVMAGLELTRERYLKIIDGKTARLFATACALGNPQLEEFGLHYGRVFQLKDDIDDREDTPFTRPLVDEETAVARRCLQDLGLGGFAPLTSLLCNN